MNHKYLVTKTQQILKFIGFFMMYQLSSIFIDLATTAKSELQIANLLFAGLIATCFTIGFLIWRYQHQLKANNPFHFRKHRLDKKAVAIFCGFLILLMAIQITWSTLVSNKFISEPTNQKIVEQSLNQLLIPNYIYAGIFAPIIEELIFRGIFLNYFFKLAKNRFNQVIGVIICGALFGFMHTFTFDINWIFYSAMGIVLSSVYVYFKDIRYNIALHMFNNLI